MTSNVAEGSLMDAMERPTTLGRFVTPGSVTPSYT